MSSNLRASRTKITNLLKSNEDHQSRYRSSLTWGPDKTSNVPSPAMHRPPHHTAPRELQSTLTRRHIPLHMLLTSPIARWHVRWNSSNNSQSTEDESDQDLSKSLEGVLNKLSHSSHFRSESSASAIDQTRGAPNIRFASIRRLRAGRMIRFRGYSLRSSSQTGEKSLVPQMTNGDTSVNPEEPSNLKLQPKNDEADGARLTHVNPTGAAQMVNVGSKAETRRAAIAYAWIAFGNQDTFPLVIQNQIKKGDVLSVARIAGIMAAKRTSDLIPLCHPINITKADVQLNLVKPGSSRTGDTRGPYQHHGSVAITAHVECMGQTGVEMEAMTAAMGAALTIYDMCKATDREMRIGHAKLLYKSGGKSGLYVDRKWAGTVGKKFFVNRGLEVPDLGTLRIRPRELNPRQKQHKAAQFDELRVEELRPQGTPARPPKLNLEEAQSNEVELSESAPTDSGRKELQSQTLR